MHGTLRVKVQRQIVPYVHLQNILSFGKSFYFQLLTQQNVSFLCLLFVNIKIK